MTDFTAYDRLRQAIAGEPLPLALVDLDAFDANLELLLAGARAHGKRIRLASKSIRSVALLRRAVDRGGDDVVGVMAYTVQEAAYLVERGFTDIFVAYPTAQRQDAETLAELNRRPEVKVGIVVDCEEHLDRLAHAGGPIPVVVEVDLAVQAARGRLNIGVRRSPLRTSEQVLGLVRAIASRDGLRFGGVMAYEAQVAGLTDQNPFTRSLNPVKRVIRQRSAKAAAARRAELAKALTGAGFAIELFNGGGTGSLSFTARDSVVTEVAAGSGLLVGHLFDYYSNIDLQPAAYFAVQIVRRPSPEFVTCLGGGYVASGEIGLDRLPIPAQPPGLSLTRFEAAGEVQTPLAVRPWLRPRLHLGDPVFFRHAKSGELAEHFEELLLIRGNRIEDRVPTYRGDGRVFL